MSFSDLESFPCLSLYVYSYRLTAGDQIRYGNENFCGTSTPLPKGRTL